ncbi:hypothetical protein [Streptomyces boncukensis]|uniref:Secreted protein n=1 Tax=Streptomyces boncukensis TaxID=2711219 RepID=A0A6G4X092_9ACTN|nr:hypothetical protein [Streptomyces boncukensis]
MTEQPHSRSRTVHWVATAAALAAVLGASAAIQPSASGAAARATAPTGAAPDPAKARYPLDCGPSGTAEPQVTAKGTADFDGDGSAETVAVVRCRAQAGTPPSGVFVLAAPQRPGARPRVAATLVPEKERMAVTGLRVDGRTVAATLLGYSSPEVPRCCPDQKRKVKWEWRDGKFALIPGPAPGSAGV